MKKHSAVLSQTPPFLQTNNGYATIFPDAYTTVEKLKTWAMGV